MTVIELFHRLGRKARGGDFTKLSLTEQTDLAEAANAAIQEVYSLLPAGHRELTEGFILPGPQAVSAGVTQNSATLATNVFTTAQIGRSVALGSDENWNRVLDTNRLLNPYLGASGTVAGTVYGDAVFSERYPFERIIGNPHFPRLQLVPVAGESMAWSKEIGEPRYWWLQNMGNSQGNKPFLVLRFSPAPERTMTINVRISYAPKRLTLADYDNATDLTVPDQFIETALIPLGLQALSMTPVWDTRGDELRFEAAAERGRKFLRTQPANLATPQRRCYTPRGF